MSTNRDKRLAETIKKDLLGLMQESMRLQEQIDKMTAVLGANLKDDDSLKKVQIRFEIFNKNATKTLTKHLGSIDALPGVRQIFENDPAGKKLIGQLKEELPKRIAAVKASHDAMMKYHPTLPKEKDPLQEGSLFKAVGQTNMKGASTTLVTGQTPKKPHK